MTQVMASAARSVAVDPPRLAVDVRATSPIGLRIGAVLTSMNFMTGSVHIT